MNKDEQDMIKLQIRAQEVVIDQAQQKIAALRKQLSVRPSIKAAPGRGFDMESIFAEKTPGAGDKVTGLGKRSKITRARPRAEGED